MKLRKSSRKRAISSSGEVETKTARTYIHIHIKEGKGGATRYMKYYSYYKKYDPNGYAKSNKVTHVQGRTKNNPYEEPTSITRESTHTRPSHGDTTTWGGIRRASPTRESQRILRPGPAWDRKKITEFSSRERREPTHIRFMPTARTLTSRLVRRKIGQRDLRGKIRRDRLRETAGGAGTEAATTTPRTPTARPPESASVPPTPVTTVPETLT